PKHLDGFFEAAKSRFFLLRFRDPPAIFFSMGVAQLIEKRQEAFLLQQFLKLGRHFDGPLLFVFPNDDIQHVTRFFPQFLADCFRYAEHMLRTAVFRQRSSVLFAVKSRLDRYVTLRPEFLLDVVWKEYERSASSAVVDLCFEF